MNDRMQNNRLGKVATAKASLFLLTILLSIFLSAYSVQQVRLETATWTVDDDGPADFQAIQEAINAAQKGDSVFVKGGVYYEHLIANRSVSLTGENRNTTIVDGGGSGTVILVTADNVTVEGFSTRNGRSGIIVAGAQNCTIRENLVEDNKDRGILITTSGNCTVNHNHVLRSKSGYGINVNASQNVLVEENGASDNYYDGIGFLSSNKSIVRANTVNNNTLYGIWVDSSHNNLFYHNNVFGNGIRVSSNTPSNSWDNGSEGNYWSNYAGVDADGDGLGDESLVVDEQTMQLDRFPLMRPYVNEVYLSVDTEPPVASFTHSPETPLVNETVSFDASESYDSVGKNAIVGYSWDFGDGTTGTGIRIDHTYPISGNVTVILTVVDVAGNEGYASVDVPVKLEDSGYERLLPAALIAVVVGGVGGVAVLLLWFKRREKQPE